MKKKIYYLTACALLLAGCATTDPNAVSVKGRIIPFPSTAQRDKPSAATTSAAGSVTVTTVNAESALYRVKLDTGDEVALLTRLNPPKGIRMGECVRVLLSSKPGYPKLERRDSKCVYAKDGSKAADANDLAKEFQADPESASVYIYRNELFYWGPMQVKIDGALVGNPPSFYYVWKHLSPGRHTISAEGTARNEVEINVEAGKNYFLWLEAKGSYGGPKPLLHVVDEEIGKREISMPELLLYPSK